jgi:probable phosphoglycerate mutase
MDTELYLVRHGETEWNTLGKFQGCTDISLSDNGIQQAELLKHKFHNQFDYIYSSPLCRAVQTADIICQDTDKKTIIKQDLREINFGEWEGLTIEQIKENYPVQFYNWSMDEEIAELVGGDLSLKNASNRVTSAINDIVKKHAGKRIIIVSHGGIIKTALIGLMDWKMTMYKKLFLDNTSVSKIVFRQDFTPILIRLNDISHLPASNL